ncbi:DUF4412 domain-containing protein [Acidiluteibacter ferrifornacis]|uniref:DUF4412 domain-containing protein n=1 Tax=Acidiluteibacter ferrifornacis TaxID=2692424 RepID=A0A6N9NJD0_9FLAO|nr:DUF4412 domain-containing protein [Acidiluteibacter ferrifornacis]NBG65297.1 DUF4412 domain-containing protein [Acidiluteibacter ferrifornacis]
MKKMIGICLASLVTLLSFGQNEMTEAQLKSMMSSMMGDVKYKDTYVFSKSIVYSTSEVTTSGAKKNTGKMEMLFSENGEEFGVVLQEENGKPVKEKMTMLMDVKGEAMITLMEDKSGERSGVAMKMPKDGVNMMGMETSENENGSITKTSQTKVIQGYTCTKYVGKSSDSSSEFWVANDLKMNFSDAFQQLFKTKDTGFNDMPEGTIMEATSIDEDGNKSMLEVVEVNPNKSTKFSPKEYNVMSMGDMMMGE